MTSILTLCKKKFLKIKGTVGRACGVFFKKFLEDIRYPDYGLLVTSALGFKARVDSLACVLPRLRTMDSSDSPLVLHLLTV